MILVGDNEFIIEKVSARLTCSCGYRARRAGWRDMLDHLEYVHTIWFIGIGNLMQDLWFGKTGKVKIRRGQRR